LRRLTGLLLLCLLPCAFAASASDALIDLPARWAGTLEAIPAAELGGQPKDVRQTLEEGRQMAINAVQANGTAQDLAEAYGQLGALYHVYLIYTHAGHCYRNAMTLDPGNFRWAYYYAELARNLGQTEAAVERLQHARSLNPDYRALDLHLANAWLDLNELEKAKSGFEAVRTVEGLQAAALKGLGQLAFMERDYAVAIDYFNQALELQPRASSIRYPLAQALRASGDREAAKAQMAQRGVLEPRITDPQIDSLYAMKNNAAVHYVRGMKAVRSGEFEVAAKFFARGLSMEPDNIHARVSLARALYLAGNTAAAEQELRKVLIHKPDAVFALFLLGLLYDGADRHGEAMRLYQTALQYDPAHAGSNYYLGIFYYREGRYTEAGRHFAAVIAADQKHVGAHILLLASREHAGIADSELAPLLREAVAMLPEQPILTLRLVQLLALSEDPDVRDDPAESLRLARALVEQQPQPPHQEALALALAANGDFKQAATIQKTLVAMALMAMPGEVERLSRVLSAYEDDRMPAANDFANLSIIPLPPLDIKGPFRNYLAVNPY
jgi:tetratricopeptide (TPR) repeat protein